MSARHSKGATTAVLAAAASVAMAAGLLGCSEDTGREEAPTPTPSRKAAPAHPYTGLTASPGPVLAVKIDNVGPARPHTGLGEADIVYVEEVEAGQSRILAVFSSRTPSKLGPVRSARESDLELLKQFGRPALAYSGAQSALRPLIESAPLDALPPGDSPGSYSRGSDRPAPHNLYVNAERLLADAPDADKASDIGFRFGAAPAGGKPVKEQTVNYPAARFTFTWSPGKERWLVSMDGSAARTTDGGRVEAATVVVQRTNVRTSKFSDRWGAVSPYTETVGSGSAQVLRDGKAYEARWSRDGAQSGTTFTTPSGKRLNFDRGPVWVVLTEKDGG